MWKPAPSYAYDRTSSAAVLSPSAVAFSSVLFVMSRFFSSMDLFESFTKDSYLHEHLGGVPPVELEPV